MTDDHTAQEILLADQPLNDADEQILRVVARMFDDLDPVPDGLLSRVTFAMTLDALHAEVAELQRLAPDLVGARADAVADATGIQTVTFTSASLTTMITITPLDPGRVRIDGWVAPAAEIAVELRLVDGSVSTVADPDGRFVFEDVVRGLGQFVLRPPADQDERPVITPSLDL